jgi:hypothetical protein
MTELRVKKQYKEEIRIFDAYINELLQMADAIYVAL